MRIHNLAFSEFSVLGAHRAYLPKTVKNSTDRAISRFNKNHFLTIHKAREKHDICGR